MEQRDFRMPATGEGWRHYKGALYTVIGMARDDKGDAYVVYTEFGWSLIQLPPIYTQPLGRFVQEIENNKPRFTFDRERGDDNDCPYINAVTGSGFRKIA